MEKLIKECTAKDIFSSESKNRNNLTYKQVLSMVLAMYENMKKIIHTEDWGTLEEAWIEVKKQIKPEILNTKINI